MTYAYVEMWAKSSKQYDTRLKRIAEIKAEVEAQMSQGMHVGPDHPLNVEYRRIIKEQWNELAEGVE